PLPDKVPFRLTNNMVDAMGASGVEGAFRSACETTYRVLQRNADLFGEVMEDLVHDPLPEWLAVRSGADRVHEGIMARMSREPVEEVVEELIQRATDLNALASILSANSKWAPHL
ncbi:serine/threonine-protein kinase M1, partial [Podila humilis]